MTPVPTPGSRLLRPGRTRPRQSKRTRQSKTNTRQKITKREKEPFGQYHQALDI